MKKKSIFIIIFLTVISQWAYSQSQCFTYDAAGNRTSRAVCAARISPDDINMTMVDKIAQMSERNETELRSSFAKDLSQLVVYPNPSSGIFSIAGLENVSDCALRVLDNTGKEVWSQKGVPESIDLTHLPSGKYYFFMIGSDSIKSMQIIITK
ncbi:MAG: T9SS type A sorting domain-containing protein [Saprospiraceae bacterium]|nr:T9SS type A sorting domain-containing protein [Saprospiraceae bacterium]